MPEVPNLPSPSRSTLLPVALLATLGLSACKSADDNLEVANDSIGMRITRSACPAAGIPTYTGDVTLFTAGMRTASAIDVVAEITDVKAACTDSGTGPLTSTVSFRIEGSRINASEAREVTLPYFATAIRGGTQVVSKQLGRVALSFPAGQTRAQTTAQATITLDRSAIAIPETVRNRLVKKRKATDQDASIDPMTDPEVKAAVNRASFELLVGFQLTNDQLAYNATR